MYINSLKMSGREVSVAFELVVWSAFGSGVYVDWVRCFSIEWII